MSPGAAQFGNDTGNDHDPLIVGPHLALGLSEDHNINLPPTSHTVYPVQ